MFDTAQAQRPAQRPVLRAVPPAPPLAPQVPSASAVRHPSVADESVAPTIRHWLAAALDELDYGIVLLFDDMRVVHANEAALAELDECHPLQLTGGELLEVTGAGHGIMSRDPVLFNEELRQFVDRVHPPTVPPSGPFHPRDRSTLGPFHPRTVPPSYGFIL